MSTPIADPEEIKKICDEYNRVKRKCIRNNCGKYAKDYFVLNDYQIIGSAFCYDCEPKIG